MGLLVGMVFYPIISASRRHQIITWAFRIAAIPLAVVLFVVLIRNFYTSDPYAGMLYCPLQLHHIADFVRWQHVRGAGTCRVSRRHQIIIAKGMLVTMSLKPHRTYRFLELDSPLQLARVFEKDQHEDIYPTLIPFITGLHFYSCSLWTVDTPSCSWIHTYPRRIYPVP